DQVLCRDRTDAGFTVRVEEVDEDGLALEEIVVEPHAPVVLGAEHDVGEVLGVITRDRTDAARQLALVQVREHRRRGRDERYETQQEQPLPARHGTIFHMNIMAWSSWTTLWQWVG